MLSAIDRTYNPPSHKRRVQHIMYRDCLLLSAAIFHEAYSTLSLSLALSALFVLKAQCACRHIRAGRIMNVIQPDKLSAGAAKARGFRLKKRQGSLNSCRARVPAPPRELVRAQINAPRFRHARARAWVCWSAKGRLCRNYS